MRGGALERKRRHYGEGGVEEAISGGEKKRRRGVKMGRIGVSKIGVIKRVSEGADAGIFRPTRSWVNFVSVAIIYDVTHAVTIKFIVKSEGSIRDHPRSGAESREPETVFSSSYSSISGITTSHRVSFFGDGDARCAFQQ